MMSVIDEKGRNTREPAESSAARERGIPARGEWVAADAGAAALAWQRRISERLFLSALREEELARSSVEASERSRLLAAVSRDLSMSLDEQATRAAVRRLTLSRAGTWCIVDVVEPDGSVSRLPVGHADPARERLSRVLEELWPTRIARADAMGAPVVDQSVETREFASALALAAGDEMKLRVLREAGFGSALVVPLIVRAKAQGTLTFLSEAGDPPFNAEEIDLAIDLAARAAMALDNARQYHAAEDMRIAADQANRAKGEFLARISHELRTPLNAISGLAQTIDLGIRGPVTDEQHAALARIMSNQEHLAAMITEILDYALAEHRQAQFVLEDVALAQVLSEVADGLRQQVSDKKLILRGPTGDDVHAFADTKRVRQILVNLLTNAVKYTPHGGGTITLSCRLERNVALVDVADTGLGIPRDYLESVFEPFVQLADGLRDRRGGVGLGLAISRDLARAMGGNLTVVSEEGVGSVFTLALPVVPAKLG